MTTRCGNATGLMPPCGSSSSAVAAAASTSVRMRKLMNPRPGDLERLTQVVEVELGDDVGGHLARRAPLLLRQAQRDVRLEVPELRLGRRAHLRVDADDGAQPGVEKGGK